MHTLHDHLSAPKHQCTHWRESSLTHRTDMYLRITQKLLASRIIEETVSVTIDDLVDSHRLLQQEEWTCCSSHSFLYVRSHL